MKRFITVVLVFITFTSDAQITLNGVTLPAELSFNAQMLELNGGGIRSKYFFDLYTAGLYLEQKSKDANAIVEADEMMAIHLEVTSSLITSDRMADAIKEGFEKSTDGNTAFVQDRIDELLKTFSNEAINLSDVFDIVYVPDLGTQTYKNGLLKSTIAGLDFKLALFGIWLSDDPVSSELKQGLLGL